MWPERAEDAAGERFGSEVVVRADRLPVQASRVPHINNLNVTEHSTVHVGPKIVTVNQSVHNTEVVKGRFLCLDLVYASRSLRCSVAVFICWTLVLACGILIYLFCLVMTKTAIDIGLNEHWYLRRYDWQAMSPYMTTYLQLPLTDVLIRHSAEGNCTDKYTCKKTVLAIQESHLRRGYHDIDPNFLIGGEGLIFEGRGVNALGFIAIPKKERTITIMFLGDYRRDRPNQAQIDHMKQLLDVLEKENILRSDYELYGICQVLTFNISPGPNIIEQLHQFSHWNPHNKEKCWKGWTN